MNNNEWKIIKSPCDDLGVPDWPLGSIFGMTSVFLTMHKGYFEDGIVFEHNIHGTLKIVTKLVHNVQMQVLHNEERDKYYKINYGKRVSVVKNSVVKEITDDKKSDAVARNEVERLSSAA